jgi:hypothetical protein
LEKATGKIKIKHPKMREVNKWQKELPDPTEMVPANGEEEEEEIELDEGEEDEYAL